MQEITDYDETNANDTNANTTTNSTTTGDSEEQALVEAERTV